MDATSTPATPNPLIDQLRPHLPEDAPDHLLPTAAVFFEEITPLPYERIAILLAIQHEMITNLTTAIQRAQEEHLKRTTVKAAYEAAKDAATQPTPSPIIRPRFKPRQA